MNNLEHLNLDEIMIIHKLIEGLKIVYPNINSLGLVSKKTQHEYIAQAQFIIRRRNNHGSSLLDVVNSTNKKSTYFKKIAALKYYLAWIGSTAALTLNENRDEDSLHNIKLAVRDIGELQSAIETGFIGSREKRKSKRTSLKGLPQNWMERLCNYNANSKYRTALLIMCLTGCRPAELVQGVDISLSEDIENKKFVIEFEIIGAKLSDTKGQPIRKISYVYDPSNKLLSALIDAISLTESKSVTVSIENAVNFTNEVKRIAKILWPSHKEHITSYSIRHQIASNFKKHLNGDDVSKALGHASPKTKKSYGSASQSKGKAPEISISASREINQPPLKSDELDNQ
jgi:integrase